MVIGASTGPMEKSAWLTGGKSDAELGAEVGSVVIEEQLTSEVGVSRMIGCSTMGGVGVEIISDEAQALRMNKKTMDEIIIKRFRIICFLLHPVIVQNWSSMKSC